MQINYTESLLTLVFCWYQVPMEESLGGHGIITVLHTIALQVPLDRACGELPSDT